MPCFPKLTIPSLLLLSHRSHATLHIRLCKYVRVRRPSRPPSPHNVPQHPTTSYNIREERETSAVALTRYPPAVCFAAWRACVVVIIDEKAPSGDQSLYVFVRPLYRGPGLHGASVPCSTGCGALEPSSTPLWELAFRSCGCRNPSVRVGVLVSVTVCLSYGVVVLTDYYAPVACGVRWPACDFSFFFLVVLCRLLGISSSSFVSVSDMANVSPSLTFVVAMSDCERLGNTRFSVLNRSHCYL